MGVPVLSLNGWFFLWSWDACYPVGAPAQGQPPKEILSTRFSVSLWEEFITQELLSGQAPEYWGELCRELILPVAALWQFPCWAAGGMAMHVSPLIPPFGEFGVVWQRGKRMLRRELTPSSSVFVHSQKHDTTIPEALPMGLGGQPGPRWCSFTSSAAAGPFQRQALCLALPSAKEEQHCRYSWLRSHWAGTHGSKT